jgi:hypothetical protein
LRLRNGDGARAKLMSNARVNVAFMTVCHETPLRSGNQEDRIGVAGARSSLVTVMIGPDNF